MDENYVNQLAAALRKIGTIHTVGEEWHSYAGEIPAGGVPYAGQTVSRETYAVLWQYAQDKGLVKPEAEWQTLAASGNVKFYSDGDGATTFRMPKVTNDATNGVYAFGVITNVDGIDVNAFSAELQALAASAVKTVNNQTPNADGNVWVDVGVEYVNGIAPINGAVDIDVGVTSVNGQTGAVTIQSGGVTSVNGMTGAVTLDIAGTKVNNAGWADGAWSATVTPNVFMVGNRMGGSVLPSGGTWVGVELNMTDGGDYYFTKVSKAGGTNVYQDYGGVYIRVS